MKHHQLLYPLVLFAAASCSDDIENDILSDETEQNSVKETIIATISDGLYDSWNIGDNIMLAHDGNTLSVETLEAGQQSQLSDKIDNMLSDDKTLFGVFPADNYVSSEPECVTVSIPASQKSENNGFDKKSPVAVARSTTETLKFHTVCGGIRLNFQMSGVTKVELESVDGYPLAGIAMIKWDNEGLPIIHNVSGAASIITFVSHDNSGFTPGTDYYISTLPCDTYGGYRLSIYKDGLVAHYFGVHQNIVRTDYITPTDLVENELEFDDPDAPLVEEERPELDEHTNVLLRQYQKSPTEENKQALLNQMGIRYDKVVARKKAKLRELEREAKHQALVDEMQEIVDEMVENRDIRLEQQFLRLIDPRVDDNPNDAWMVLRGAAAPNAYIGYAPVTNAEYAVFKKDFSYESGKENYPVVYISVAEASAYCDWLTAQDPRHIYRLPSDEEWILGAGHMPKDVQMNSGHIERGLTPVDAYKQTTGACGGIDFWGNSWEWTTTTDASGDFIIKGGSWDSDRDDCRSEKSDVVRNGSLGYSNVGFRVVRIDRDAN